MFADTYDSYFKSFSGDYNPSPNLEDLSIGAFYEQQAEALLRYFYRRTADPDVAADLCAETFAAALENAHRYNPQRGTPAQWLYGIARNQLAMFWRRHKAGERARRRLGIPREPIDETTATELREAENLINGAEAVEALNTLPHKLRSAVVLRVVDQLGYAEIAAELGCSPGAARVRVFRGLQRLSEVLK
ncbi:RNA polymerase sigma factor [Candidatus Poriferisocius sp.]|uniref:RNA polymerase sigma factor n=1 Tax=Candidatus Poriferisocius sp. TaxID=3101276 RepID=UPI003B021F74